MTSPITPRDAIGLSERLRDAKRRWVPIMASHPAFADAALLTTMDEAATQLDALRSEINEWANEVARYKAYAEKFDQENAELRARVKELEAESERLLAHMVPISKDGNHVFIDGAGDVEIDHEGELRSRATRLQQERDEALERAAMLALVQARQGATAEQIAAAIRQLKIASGPDREPNP